MTNPVTKNGIEYVHNDDGFFPVKREHQNAEGIAECVHHHHIQKHNSSRIHWAVRAGVFGVGLALAPEAGILWVFAYVWSEFSRHMAAEGGFSQGIVVALRQYAPQAND
jgi:hypothetical protein